MPGVVIPGRPDSNGQVARGARTSGEVRSHVQPRRFGDETALNVEAEQSGNHSGNAVMRSDAHHSVSEVQPKVDCLVKRAIA